MSRVGIASKFDQFVIKNFYLTKFKDVVTELEQRLFDEYDPRTPETVDKIEKDILFFKKQISIMKFEILSLKEIDLDPRECYKLGFEDGENRIEAIIKKCEKKS